LLIYFTTKQATSVCRISFYTKSRGEYKKGTGVYVILKLVLSCFGLTKTGVYVILTKTEPRYQSKIEPEKG
jgi:hypothetical protein